MENWRFVDALNKKLFRSGCSLWIYNMTADLYWEAREQSAETGVFDLIDYTWADAVIYMDEKIKSRQIAEKVIENAKAHSVPVVVVDGSYEGCVSVKYDYARGFEKVVRHAIEFHHARKPHFIGGSPGNRFSDERLEVFRKVIGENGIPFDEESMVSYGDFWAKPAIAVTEKLIERGDMPDAIVCANDIMAFNVCNVLTEHGYAVPGDVIVTGLDGVDEIYFVRPTLTSARCGTSGLTNDVFNAVMDVMETGSTDKVYTVDPVLLLNKSCGCGCAEDNPGHLRDFNDRFYRFQDDNRVLAEICERIQTADSVEIAGQCLVSPCIHDLCVIIDKRCTNQVVNMLDIEYTPSDIGLVFFDTDDPEFRQRTIHRSEIIPHLEETMEHGYPLIFNEIDFLGIPLGLVCFHFKDCDLTDYVGIPQVLTSLSIGLGGFINWQHQKYLRSQIENMYKFDSLTGLYTRLSFINDFSNYQKIHAEENLPLTIILSDLDGLKGINDNYGHSAGDLAIAAAAEALRKACPTDAFCVRYGGDEMLAVIPGKCMPEKITAALRKNLAEFNSSSGLAFSVSVSIGTQTQVLTDELQFEGLLEGADEMMYTEKQRKKRQK